MIGSLNRSRLTTRLEKLTPQYICWQPCSGLQNIAAAGFPRGAGGFTLGWRRLRDEQAASRLRAAARSVVGNFL